MEPHGVVEAGHLQPAVGPIEAMGEHRGVEQGHVTGVGDDAGVQRGVVGQSAVGAQPHRLLHRGNARARHGVALHVTNVDGSGTLVPLAEQMLVRCHARLEVGQRVRRRDVGHVDLVRQALLGGVEAGLQVEDGLTVLDGHDATRGEALAVADAVDVVEDRGHRIAGTQEVGVQRVNPTVAVIDGPRGRHQRLSGDLSAEDALTVLLGRSSAEDVDLDGLEIQQGDEVVQSVEVRVTGGGRNHGLILARTRLGDAFIEGGKVRPWHFSL